MSLGFNTYHHGANSTSMTSSSKNITLGDVDFFSPETLQDLNERYAAALMPFSVMLGIFGVVGILGNVMVFIVYGFGKKFKDKKFRYYVIFLALIDFITCLTLIPAEMIKHTSYFNITESYLCKIKCFFNVFAASSASFCLTLIALDRYIMTCHPLLFVRIPAFSHKSAWKLCVLMMVLGAATAVPAVVLCGVTSSVMIGERGDNITVYLCESEPYYEDGIARYMYRFVLCLVQAVISILIIILYAKIGIAVMRALKIRQANCQKQETMALHDYKKRSSKPTNHVVVHPPRQIGHNAHVPSNIKLLFVVTVVFIVTYIFYASLSWIDQTKLNSTQFLFFNIFYRLYFVHSIINPILYVKMDKYFRKRCVKMIQKLC